MTPAFDIFICYRQSLSAWPAVLLYNRYFEAFGDTVFIDHECLRAGKHWRDDIDAVIADTSVMVVLLSPGWIDVIERKRASNEADEVIREVCVALKFDKPLLPVYLDDSASASAARDKFSDGTDQHRAIQALADAHSVRCRSSTSDIDLGTLIEETTAYLPRFPKRFAHRCRERLERQLSGHPIAGAWDEKFESFLSALRRPELDKAISDASFLEHRLLVIKGEEGMGKTYALGWAMRMFGDGPVLLVEARDAIWTAGFVAGVEAVLLAGDAQASCASGQRCLASTAELNLAMAQPLLIAIDGLNEYPTRDWCELLNEGLASIASGRPWRIVVSVRTDAWADRFERRLRRQHGSLEVPKLTLGECKLLAERLSFRWEDVDSEVREQLRRPRMLMAVAGIPPDRLTGFELSYPLVMLLHLQQSGDDAMLNFDTICDTLREIGRVTNQKLALTRDVLREQLSGLSESNFELGLEQLCDFGVLHRRNGKLRAHPKATCVALGLYLLGELNSQEKPDFVALREHIARFICDSDHESVSEVLSHAIVARLLPRIDGSPTPLDEYDPMLAALFVEWDRRFNRDYAPARLARWLLPEFLWLSENKLLSDRLDWLQSAIDGGPRSEWAPVFAKRLDRWFSGVNLENDGHTGPGPADEAEIAKRHDQFQQARALGNLIEVGEQESRLRRLGLELAARCSIDPRSVNLLALVLSVTVQPAGGWDELGKWVRTYRVDWWPILEPIWQRVHSAQIDNELRADVAKLLFLLWPTDGCRQLVQPPDPQHHRPKFAEPIDYTRLVDAMQLPDGDAEMRLRRKLDSNGLYARDPELAAAALWLPTRLQQYCAELVDRVSDSSKSIDFFGTKLAAQAPLLTPEQTRRLRKLVRERTDIERAQSGHLGFAGWFNLPDARRASAVLSQMRENNLAKDALRGAWLSVRTAAAVTRRLSSKRWQSVQGRIAQWLLGVFDATNEFAIRDALVQVLPLLHASEFSDSAEYWLLLLCLAFELESDATHLIPSGWRYVSDEQSHNKIDLARSAILAESGSLAPDEIRQLCHRDHWHLVAEPERTQFLAERISINRAKFFSRTSMPMDDTHRIREIVDSDPDFVAEVIADPGPLRVNRAEDVAAAIKPGSSPHWLDLVTLVCAQPSLIRTTVNGIGQKFIVAFKAADSEQMRRSWDGLLDGVEHDADLLQLVIAAKRGHRAQWLADRAQIATSAIPHRQLRAATIAAMIGSERAPMDIERAKVGNDGWIAKGFENALAMYQTDQLAQAWYRRFRASTNWFEAVGSWSMHCQLLDLRHLLWDRDSLPQFALAESARFEYARRNDINHACENRAKELRKTRFGIVI